MQTLLDAQYQGNGSLPMTGSSLTIPIIVGIVAVVLGLMLRRYTRQS